MTWQARPVTSVETLDAGPVLALGALLDSGAPAPAAGDVLLVVQGSLSTLVLAEALRLTHPDRDVRRLQHRNTAPLFCGDPARVTVDATTPDTAEVALRRPDGTALAGLTAELATATL